MTYRTQISLDGIWDFQLDANDRCEPADVLSNNAWRAAVVPMPWQAQFDDLHNASGTGWYRRSVTVDEAPHGSAHLHFGAVDYFTTVWLNGQLLGEHEGGYLPFEFDVTALLQVGENELVVRAIDPADDATRWPEYPFSEIPHGKQSWYMPVGGIWQSVGLEMRPVLHLRKLFLTPDVPTSRLQVLAKVQGNVQEGETVRVRVLAPNGDEVASGVIFPGQPEWFQLDPAALRLWSPETPWLYEVQATLMSSGEAVDEISATCGFRQVEVRDRRIHLNGQPIYLRSALDQAYYPETVYTVPSVEYLEDQARKAKALGLNCLRTHIKVEDPRYYEVADRLGLLIWTEIPNWMLLSEEASWRAKETFAGMVERDWNHPSIFCWTLINENWGTDLTYNPEHRAWLEQFYREAKAIDPTRLVVDNSVCNRNPHVASDLDDVHEYRAIPDHAAQWDAWVAACAKRLDWSWAEEYKANRHDDLPIIVSEFGNWGLPDPRSIQEKGADPWWFETGYNFGTGIVYPHNMRQRYEESDLCRLFDSFEQFIQASQEHMARSLAYEISSMRLHPEIGGYVITEFTDVHWECNGLMTMQRDIKYGLDRYFVPLNQARVVVVRPQRWSGRPGEQVPVEIHCMGVTGPVANGLVRWYAGAEKGELAAPGGVVQIRLPEQNQSSVVTVRAEWQDDDGQMVAENLVELACVTSAPLSGKAVFVENDAAMADLLRSQGYNIVEQPEEAGVIVAHVFTEALRSRVQRGARLLLLLGPNSRQEAGAVGLPFLSIVAREGTPWEGDWATSFSWLRKNGPFAALPGGPLLEMAYADLMPDAVLFGLQAWAEAGHSWAGLALGWIHRVVSLLASLSYGRGKLTATTFKLTSEALASNPIAQTLFAGLVELAS